MFATIKRIGRVAKFPINAVGNYFRPPLLVLGYHRIATLDSDPYKLSVPPKVFFEQMRWISKNYQTLSVKELERQRKGPSILITFDDGYADNVIEALPILRRLKIPALLFVVTGAVDGEREFFWDALERLTAHGNLGDTLRTHKGKDAPMTDKRNSTRTLFALWSKIRTLPSKTRITYMTSLYKKIRLSEKARPTHKRMNLSQIRAWQASPGMHIGGHTRSHAFLPGASLKEQRNEILGSFSDLRRMGIEASCFAYPYGDYDRTSIETVKQSRYQYAFTTKPGPLRKHTSLLEIPRVFLQPISPAYFVRHVRRAFLRN